MTGIPSYEHHDLIKASGQINKRRDKGASYEQQSSRELCVIKFNTRRAEGRAK